MGHAREVYCSSGAGASDPSSEASSDMVYTNPPTRLLCPYKICFFVNQINL